MLGDWSLDRIRALLEQGVFESDRFDFKERLPVTNAADDKLRLKKVCASFANSSGGFLIFGVKDAKGLAAEERLVGLNPTEDFPELFGNFPTAAEPGVEWDFRNPALRLPNGNFVHIVHVPASRRGPHAVSDKERWWFCKRTSKGTEPMTYEEVRAAFAETAARMSELAWLVAEVGRIRNTAERLNMMSARGEWSLDMLLTRLDVGQARALLVSVFSFLGDEPRMLGDLQLLFDRCVKVDEILAPAAIFAMHPSGSHFSQSSLSTAQHHLPQIVHGAERLLPLLEQRTK